MRVAKRNSTKRGHRSGAIGKFKPEVGSADCNREQAALLPLRRAAKRAFDIVIAIIGLVLFSPILLLSSLAIMLDSRGPIVSTHVRH